MLSFWRKRTGIFGAAKMLHKAVSAALEPLENRRLLSASWGGFDGGPHGSGGPPGGFGGGGGGGGGDTT